MDSTETPIVPSKKPVKRKAKKVKRAAAPKPGVAASGPFAGLTVAACCKACDVDGCVISGKPYCAHPRKGGLHASEMHDKDAMRRAQQAQRVLGEQILDARST